MTKTFKQLYEKYKEIILYIIFGILTTAVNFFVFWIFTKILGEELYLLNNSIAWVAGVVFAYVTNKLFVFDSKNWSFKIIGKEVAEFFAARLFSFGVEEGGMFLFITVLHLGEKSLSVLGITITGQFTIKIFLAVIVVILNYIFSKFIIFKKHKNSGSI